MTLASALSTAPRASLPGKAGPLTDIRLADVKIAPAKLVLPAFDARDETPPPVRPSVRQRIAGSKRRVMAWLTRRRSLLAPLHGSEHDIVR